MVASVAPFSLLFFSFTPGVAPIFFWGALPQLRTSMLHLSPEKNRKKTDFEKNEKRDPMN